jgi:formylglycine-generating enzyme required for sulfatase activity
MLAVTMLAAGGAWAGNLTPPGAPGATMNTLTELYQKLTNTLAEAQAANQKLVTTTQQVAVLKQQLADLEARLNADGKHVTVGDMVLIPAGSFVMGATTNVGHETISDAVPQHTVTVSAFYMDKYEVTSNLWAQVYTWATNKGYSFGTGWRGKAANHPVRSVDWYDAIAWCNARSQRDGFSPCYTNANGTVYTNAAANSFAGGCNWATGGYRLPTEAEWEKAARGGVANRRFPWHDANTIQHARANYYAAPASYTYDTNPTTGYHPTYNTGGTPYTSPVGSFAPNGYGLYDMAGNVFEWCWDWYSSTYYASSPGTDPAGPAGPLTYRVLRGGGSAYIARCACRSAEDVPDDEVHDIGFRCARGL